MRFSLNQKRLSHLLLQRNFLVSVSATLLVSNVLLTALVFTKKTRVIIAPPDMRQQYWIEGNRFSPSYVEEMALHMAHLLLDVTESCILAQGEVVLRWVSPDAYGSFKGKLLDDLKRLKKDQVSLHFAPSELEIFKDGLSVDITGNLMTYVASKKVTDVKETYRLKFVSRHDKLLLESFTLIKSETEKENE